MNESQPNQRPSGDNQRARGPSGLVTACDQCYRCKVRCSGARESCDRCHQNGSICTYSLGKPLGKPPKNGRGRAPKNKTQRAKRLRCSTDDTRTDGLEVPQSLTSSSNGSGSGSGTKRCWLGDVQKPNPAFITACRDISTTCLDDSPDPIAQRVHADSTGNETAADTALLGFDMDMPLDLDLDMSFSFFMDSPGPRTLALERHPIPTPVVTTTTSAIDIDTGTSASASASTRAPLITPPSSLASAVEAPPAPAQLWTPAFLRLVLDLYAVPHSTVQRFDKTLLLARQGIDFIISYLPDLGSPFMSDLTPQNFPLLCVLIAQQVLASYKLLKSQISSRLSSSSSPTPSSSRPTPTSSTSPSESANKATGESVYIGSFEVEGLESQCHVMKTVVSLEIERFEKVLIRLEEWTQELSKDGKEEGELAHLLLAALRACLSS
ncbi:hypothetical protein B7463_g3486, partial [Scytalidium lignicola]